MMIIMIIIIIIIHNKNVGVYHCGQMCPFGVAFPVSRLTGRIMWECTIVDRCVHLEGHFQFPM